jgi:hypothetical protein
VVEYLTRKFNALSLNPSTARERERERFNRRKRQLGTFQNLRGISLPFLGVKAP